MSEFVTFASLAEDDYFLARGKFHCKGSVGIFQKQPDQIERTNNAFYFDGPVGKWTHFDELTLIRRYDESIHGQPAGIIQLRDRIHF